jgi:hypothetical protein
MKNFFKQLLNGLQRTQQALAALEAAGVDVDRLMDISNAQGPQAKLIKAILSGAAKVEDLSPEEMAALPVKQLPSKKRPKAKPSKSS